MKPVPARCDHVRKIYCRDCRTFRIVFFDVRNEQIIAADESFERDEAACDRRMIEIALELRRRKKAASQAAG